MVRQGILKKKGRGRIKKKSLNSAFLCVSMGAAGMEGGMMKGEQEKSGRRTEKVIREAAFPIHIEHDCLHCCLPPWLLYAV